jgi:holo-[acyl-carrier protein] synthase
MIYSVGIDLIEIDRIRRNLERWEDRFIARILGDEERILYQEKSNKVQFVAGRFAAKEAVIKALGSFLETGVHPKDIQILNDLSGKPYVHLENTVRERVMDKEIKVSITHERKMAAAVAVMSGD